jgi:atypical dual specificity phosphatase
MNATAQLYVLVATVTGVSDWFDRFGRAEVADGLVIGAFPLDADDVSMLRAEGITTVLNLCQDIEYEDGERGALDQLMSIVGIEEMRVPCLDHGNLLSGALERASDLAIERLKAGERVYVHCRAGWQRSAAVAAAVVARRENVEPDVALGMIKRRKPSADPLPHQIEDLRSWWRARQPRVPATE